MNRTIAITIVLTLALAGGLFAGGQTEETTAPAIEVSDPGEFPIVNETYTMSMFNVQPSTVEDFETNDFTLWLEEKTNVHIDWELAPSASLNEKRTLLLASGDYPAVFHQAGTTLDELVIYGGQGVFRPLQDLIAEHTVELNRIFDEHPEYQAALTTPDGNQYDLAIISDCYHCTFSLKMWILKDWLERLDLEMPTTTEEFYDVLMAFKTQDPNGNGEQDEIPLSGAVNGWRTKIPGALMTAFIYYDDDRYFAMEDDKVQFVANKPKWREGLRYIKRLYDDGLLDPNALTQERSQLTSIAENPGKPILGASLGGWFGQFTVNGAESGRYKLYEAVPPLKGPDGFRTTGYFPYPLRPGNFQVTDQAEHPEIAIKWADLLYTQEATLRSTFGRPGEEWRWADDDQIGLNGEPAIYEVLNTYGTIQNVHWSSAALAYKSAEHRLGSVRPENIYIGASGGVEARLYDATSRLYDVGIEPDQVYPQIVYMTEDQASTNAQLQTAINSYVEESTARFITGDLDLDDDWDDYVSELDKIGLEEYLSVNQAAYDRSYR